jgi:hypothetical protein
MENFPKKESCGIFFAKKGKSQDVWNHSQDSGWVNIRQLAQSASCELSLSLSWADQELAREKIFGCRWTFSYIFFSWMYILCSMIGMNMNSKVQYFRSTMCTSCSDSSQWWIHMRVLDAPSLAHGSSTQCSPLNFNVIHIWPKKYEVSQMTRGPTLRLG